MKHNSTCRERFYKLPKVVRIIGMAVFGLIAITIFAAIFGLAVQYLWNWLMTELFGLASITYWQALGIVVLTKILFGFGPHGKHDGKSGKSKRNGGWTPFHDDDWHFPEHLEEKFKGPGDKANTYHRFWKEEGKEAFEKYMKKIEEEEKE